MKILLVTGHFPPENSGGIGRPYSLYKYLPLYGVDVSVITKDSFGKLENEKNIYRFDSFINWRSSPVFSRKFVNRVISFIGYKYFHIYTDSWWRTQVLQNAKHIISDNKIDTVYVTYPSAEALKIGLVLKEKYSINLVAEFRDGLIFEPIVPGLNFIQKNVSASLEKEIVKKSDVIITIGNTISEYFREKYKSNNVFTVFNGFDSDDFADVKTAEKGSPTSSKIKIANFGSFGATKASSRSELFIALERLMIEGKITSANFELSLIGRYTNFENDLILKHNLQELVKIYPSMPKKAGLKYLYANFDFLLFYGVKGEKSIISSKLLEYINLDMPIIGICKGNEAEKIIYETSTGIVSGFDVESIYSTFVRILESPIDFNPNQIIINTFSRKRQAEQISEILYKTIDKSGYPKGSHVEP